jgi:uncharacterized protein (DUF1330 family)
MSSYVLFDNLEVLDAAKLDDYKPRASAVVARYGGRYVVLGGPAQILEGNWSPIYPVMLEFPTRAHASAWYESSEYRALKAMRLSAVRSSAVLLTGMGPDDEAG